MIGDARAGMAAFPALAAFLPPGSRRAVAVGQADMDSLEPLNFLTTNIVEFYGL